MTEFLLRIFGIKMDNAAHISGVQVVLRNSGAVGWIILLAVLLGAMTWWSYWRDTREWVTPARRRVLTALRILLFLLLLLILLRPVFAFTIEGTIRRTLINLIDTSASMKIADPRFDEADRKRAALASGALDIRKGLDQPLDAKQAAQKPVPRVELLRGVLRNDDLGLLGRVRAADEVVRLAHEAPMGRIRQAGRTAPEHLALLAACRIDAQNTTWTGWSQELLARARGHGLRAFGSLAQTKAELADAASRGLDGIYSDHLTDMKAALGAALG